MSIRVIVADDHDLVRTGIVRLLADCPDICVIAEVACGLTAIDACRKLRPDVIVLDVTMPNLDGVETAKKIKQVCDCKILVLSVHTQEPYPSLLIKAGVNGYITKGAPFSEMIDAIKKVAHGQKYFSSDIDAVLADSLLSDNSGSPFDLLSTRERQVAMMVVNCDSIQSIADKLFVSPKTVNTYRYRIFEKLGVDSNVKLTHLALRHGLLTATDAPA